MKPKEIICPYCDAALDEEGRESPRRDMDGEPMCDECYQDHCQSACHECEEWFTHGEWAVWGQIIEAGLCPDCRKKSGEQNASTRNL